MLPRSAADPSGANGLMWPMSQLVGAAPSLQAGCSWTRLVTSQGLSFLIWKGGC